MNEFEKIKLEQANRINHIASSFKESNTDSELVKMLDSDIKKGFDPDNDHYTDILKGQETEEQKKKVKKVMDEWKSGSLKSSSGQKITDRKQAIAVALSEAGLSNK